MMDPKYFDSRTRQLYALRTALVVFAVVGAFAATAKTDPGWAIVSVLSVGFLHHWLSQTKR